MAKDKNWIQKSINEEKKGSLHKALHVPLGKKIPKTKLEKAAHSTNKKLKEKAIWAENVRKSKPR